MGGGSAIIHVNSKIENQVRIAAALRRGTGWRISHNQAAPADLHICIGPWFALNQWRHGNTLYIDRAYWGDPECVSVHWLKDGEKLRTRGRPYRDHPELQPMKTGDRRLYLCDYGEQPTGQFDAVRYHPAQQKSATTLQQDLDAHDIAIGKRTTALVEAAIQGLRIETDDPHSPVYGITDREQWIRDLAWHNWSLDELASGEFLDAIGTTHNADKLPGDGGAGS